MSEDDAKGVFWPRLLNYRLPGGVMTLEARFLATEEEFQKLQLILGQVHWPGYIYGGHSGQLQIVPPEGS